MSNQGPPDWIQAFMAQQQQQMTRQQQQMQALQEQQQAQVQALQNALAQTNNAIQALRQPTPPPVESMQITTPLENSDPTTQRTKPILPNLSKFDGSRSEYEG